MKKYLLFALAAMLLASACSDEEVYVYNTDVCTIDEMQLALNEGWRVIKMTKPMTSDAALVIPNFYPPYTELYLEIPAGGYDLLIINNLSRYGSPGRIYLTVKDAGNLTVNTPQTTVEFDGSVTGDFTVATAPGTLILDETAVVGRLIVLQGNVEIFGSVTEVVNQSPDAKVIWSAGTLADLRNLLAQDPSIVGGVILTADIADAVADPSDGSQANEDLFTIGVARDLADYYTPSPYDGFIFDGGGHTLSGVAHNNVLAVYANNAVIRNLKVTQSDDDKAARANTGISLYRVTGVTLWNVAIESCGKDGLVVNAATATATNLATGRNMFGGVNVTKGEAPSGGNTPEFTLVSGKIQDDPQIYVDLDMTGSDYVVNVPRGWYSGQVGDYMVYSTSPVTGGSK